MTPQLASHPQIPCSRCGAFIASPAELKLLDGKSFCATCAARPDVNYLETFRLKYWGKRDGWAWFIGLAGLLSLVNVAQAVGAGQYAAAVGALLGAALNICFFLGLRWARYGLLASMMVAAGISALAGMAGAGDSPERLGAAVGTAVGTYVIPMLIALAIINDTRNQLFFKVEVPRAKLQKAWDLYMNNTPARAGFMLALLGVFMPPLAPIGLVASIVGLRNVDPHSTPPIGRKGQAIAGIVLSSLSVLAWGGALISTLVARSAQ